MGIPQIKNILLMGKPKSGKTTLVKELVKTLNSCAGFYTEEILENKERIGFKILTLDGKEGILAKKGLNSKFKLGIYGINLKDLEEIGTSSIENALTGNKQIIIIDEIGKMELNSPKFKEIVLKALNSKKKVLATIPVAKLAFIEEIYKRDDIKILEIKRKNQKEVLKKILSFLQ